MAVRRRLVRHIHRLQLSGQARLGSGVVAAPTQPFEFTPHNFRNPELPKGLSIQDVPLLPATDATLKGFGRIIHASDEVTVENGNFEIVPWPTLGWRKLDPKTGDEAGTTEGYFDVHWEGDYFYGHNLAINTVNNMYLDGLGAPPEVAQKSDPRAGDGTAIYLWMTDYHPDGAQLFWPLQPIPFTVCLGSREHGDDIRPEHMRAFAVPAGKGVYFHPSTRHNGVYIRPEHSPTRFLTRQGRVHARVSCSWAVEFGKLLRVPLA